MFVFVGHKAYYPSKNPIVILELHHFAVECHRGQDLRLLLSQIMVKQETEGLYVERSVGSEIPFTLYELQYTEN